MIGSGGLPIENELHCGAGVELGRVEHRNTEFARGKHQWKLRASQHDSSRTSLNHSFDDPANDPFGVHFHFTERQFRLDNSMQGLNLIDGFRNNRLNLICGETATTRGTENCKPRLQVSLRFSKK